MILHICGDEKFIDLAIYQFEKVSPNNNRYVVLLNSKQDELEFIKNRHQVEIITIHDLEYKLLINSITNYDAVILHYLDDIKFKLIEDCPTSTKFVWMFWGQDAQKIFTNFSYKLITHNLLFKLKRFNEYLWPLTNTFRRLIFPYRKRYKLLKRIEYCAPVISEEFIIMKKSLKLHNLKELEFTYGAIEKIIPLELINKFSTGNNILVGNSSTLACNHLDSFKMLSKINLEGRKIYAPLSYGDMEYKKYVINSGVNYFNNSFIPIEGFIDLHEYVNLISDCRIAIMDHCRQQALGNIIILMWLGGKIYLNPVNPLYIFFTKRGYYIFSIKKINKKNENVFKPLNIEEININRIKLLEDFGENTITSKTKKMVEILTRKN